MDATNNLNRLLDEKIMQEILHSGPAYYRQAHLRTDPDAQWKAELSAQDASDGNDDIFSLIGRRCVALGLDFASRLFAIALVRAMAGEMGQVTPPPGQHVADPLADWDFLASTWQSALEGDQTAMLEEVIALGFDTRPPGSRPAPAPQASRTAIEDTGSQTLAGCRPTVPPYSHELTAREVEVLRLLATGLSNSELACRLVLSRRTIHAHLRSIYTKIGVNTRAAATRYAVLQGLAV